ncbi:BA75_01348T0 [Komagataella pastoris]|uniref:Telomere replication protein EST3 n=1 Tax=Komagataella pastoris TaxID=4922 RepID=A0A1B2J886_PICPA|nr:BA75_01348T0 [Komagataella pastoris]
MNDLVKSNIFVCSWLLKALNEVKNETISKIPKFNRTPRVMKVLRLITVSRDLVRLIICDSTNSILAEISADAIAEIEYNERQRFSKGIVNTEILVLEASLVFTSLHQLMPWYGPYLPPSITTTNGEDYYISKYAVLEITKLSVFNRDQVKELVDIPLVYLDNSYSWPKLETSHADDESTFCSD